MFKTYCILWQLSFYCYKKEDLSKYFIWVNVIGFHNQCLKHHNKCRADEEAHFHKTSLSKPKDVLSNDSEILSNNLRCVVFTAWVIKNTTCHRIFLVYACEIPVPWLLSENKELLFCTVFSTVRKCIRSWWFKIFSIVFF